MAAKERNHLSGVTEADYLTWKHHPVTKLLHQFLRDYQRVLQREGWASLHSGKVDQELLLELVGRSKAVLEIETLPFGAIETFYSRSEEEDGSEVIQDETS